MDIAKTIEPFCNFSLTDWQREYVQKLYDAEMEGNHLVYCIPPRGTSRHTTEVIHALVILAIALQEGSINFDGGGNI